jgi:hypothetical protein
LVHAVEEHPPADTEAVEWFLLTTINITSAADAEQCLRWYIRRWRVEDWHRVLKSGCGIEDLAHETAERLRRAIAINLVIAGRDTQYFNSCAWAFPSLRVDNMYWLTYG